MGMMRASAVLALSVALVACATAGEGVGVEELNEGGDASTSGAGGDGGDDDPMMNTTSGTGGAGGMSGTGGMAPQCEPPGHLCGGICVGNTPATGCYQSVSCASCPTPLHGSATCTPDGLCAAECNAPYVPNGANCVCPTQCCSDADCGGGGSTCQNGTCTTPQTCDQVQCTAICLIQGLFGLCVGNTCTCL